MDFWFLDRVFPGTVGGRRGRRACANDQFRRKPLGFRALAAQEFEH
jgi:hypothetical protein